MKIGDITFKRKYSLAQILVDIASVFALLYIVLIVYNCAAFIQSTKNQNTTGVSLDFLKWEPLIVWCVLGLVIWVISVFLLVHPRKMPKKAVISEKYMPRYCNIIDTCISCIRLMSLLVISEFCYMHTQAILLQGVTFSVQLLLQAVIIALIIWFTAIRVDSLCRVVASEQEENKKREIIEN